MSGVNVIKNECDYCNTARTKERESNPDLLLQSIPFDLWVCLKNQNVYSISEVHLRLT